MSERDEWQKELDNKNFPALGARVVELRCNIEGWDEAKKDTKKKKEANIKEIKHTLNTIRDETKCITRQHKEIADCYQLINDLLNELFLESDYITELSLNEATDKALQFLRKVGYPFIKIKSVNHDNKRWVINADVGALTGNLKTVIIKDGGDVAEFFQNEEKTQRR